MSFSTRHVHRRVRSSRWLGASAALILGAAGCGASRAQPQQPQQPSASRDPAAFTDTSMTGLVASPERAAEPEAAPVAPANLHAAASLMTMDGGSRLGTVTFEQVGASVVVNGQFTGLKPGLHGFYVHSAGDCSGKPSANGGLHFNPGNVKHGAIGATLRHVGDFGNLMVDKNGDATFEMTTDSLTVTPGADSVVGRAIIIHARKDDGKTQPSGSAGPAVACGVIGAPGQLASRTVTDSARALWDYSLGR